MKNKLFFLTWLIIFLLMTAGCIKQSTEGKTYYFDKEGNMSTTKPVASQEAVAEKLEVFYFHGTARCNSCQTMGKLVSDLMNQRYSDQIKSGVIDFRQINVDLPENKEVAKKFKASGSSLFINRITAGQDKIEQDANIWRYLGDEANFNKYLGDKIDSYLGL